MKIIRNGKITDATPEEIAQREAEAERMEKEAIPYEIAALKQQLEETDYQTLKYFEGWLTAEEYAPIKAHRQRLRNEINRLEALLPTI